MYDKLNKHGLISYEMNYCAGVHSFRMDDNGVVEISGTVDLSLLLGILGKAGRSAQLSWLQFGECSSNLFMQTSQAHPRDGRYLHAADLSRPKLPSHRAIDNENYGYGYDNPYYHSYGNNQDYYHLYYTSRQGDSQQNYDNEYVYGVGGSRVRSRSATRSRSGEDMSCCTVM